MPSIADRVGLVQTGHWETRQMPTATQRRDIDIASSDMDRLARDLEALVSGPLTRLERDLTAAGAPWTPGRPVTP